MKREDALLSVLDAMAEIQSHIAEILEVKAVEAEKSRNWLCLHISDASFAAFSDQLKKSLEVHDQLIEVLEGLTKMENGLGKNLNVLLNHAEASSEGLGGFGGMFGEDGASR